MEILTRKSVLIPFNPRILAVLETRKSILDYLKRLAALTNAYNLTRLNLI